MNEGALRSFCRSTSLLILLCLLVAGLMPGAVGSAGEPKVESEELVVIGIGTIASANLALAKEAALGNALSKGVEGYLLGRLGADASALHFERVVREILPSARELVENYHILAEEQGGNQVRVLVRVKVNRRVMEQKLRTAGILTTAESVTKVLFMVPEDNQGKLSYWWQDPEFISAMTPTDLALHKVFQERGFSSVQRRAGQGPEGAALVSGTPGLSPQDAVAWGRALEADLVIMGRVQIPLSGGVSMDLKVLDVREGKGVCGGEKIFPADRPAGTGDALVKELETMVSEMATTLVPCMRQAFKSGAPTVTRIQVRLGNLRSLRESTAFRAFLAKEVSGVQSVRQTRMKKDSVTFVVEFKGSQESFLNQVLNHESPPFPLEPGDIGPGEIVLMVQ
jgi:hypothetical protein